LVGSSILVFLLSGKIHTAGASLQNDIFHRTLRHLIFQPGDLLAFRAPYMHLSLSQKVKQNHRIGCKLLIATPNDKSNI